MNAEEYETKKAIWNMAVQQRLGFNKSCQFMDQGRVNQLVNAMALDIVNLEKNKGNDVATEIWSRVARKIAVKDFDTYKGFKWYGVGTWRSMFRGECAKFNKEFKDAIQNS